MANAKKKLPIVISVPHGGLVIPNELTSQFLLTEEEVLIDCDTWERELYDFKDDVEEYVDTDISRLVIDMNRAKDDLPPLNPDGLVKTLSVARKQVWANPSGLSKTEIGQLVNDYYDTYHQRIREAMKNPKVVLGLDCHTMLDVGPAPSGTQWEKRPMFCVGNRGSATGEFVSEPITAPASLMQKFKQLLEDNFKNYQDPSSTLPLVTINEPFTGGYITKFHGTIDTIPWIQLEINRSLYLPTDKQLTPQPSKVDQQRLTEIKNLLYKTFADLI